ncbi:OmpP1/FadL family transporter [Pseudomonas matsuisoli]|uniref:Outer membrane protein n=1 Tax=Pseudomonas matsuisoli TaxID=1515666 RepID=A0A917UWF6_9PSED|nr:outer membrane protein transport protein [Pseudomonas matsuisoli]GGJ90303.1 outer membrane protein [Pseudomonas matsuisoli]
MKKIGIHSGIALVLGALASQAHASGFALNEQSISAMGMAFSGRASAATDASTVFGNPAGMALIDREQVTLGVAGIFARSDIKDTSSTLNVGGTPVASNAGSNDGDMVPSIGIPMGYYVKPIDDRWAFGLGVYVPFGLLTDYESGFQGRYFGDYSEVEVITVQPTVSFRINDQLSVGFGPTINRISGQLESAVFGGPGIPDSRVKIEGDDTAFGFNAGILYEITPQTRVGLTYHSMVDYKLEGDTRFSGVAFGPFAGKYDAELDLKTPESVDLGITHALNDQWTLHASATWTRWSRLESLLVENQLGAPVSSIEEEQDWKDTWAYSIGAAYQLNEEWVLRAGIGIDESPANDTHRSPRVPINDRTNFSIGAGWSPTKDLTIDVAYLYLREDDADIDQSRPVSAGVTQNYSATYENSAHTVGAQLTYRF